MKERPDSISGVYDLAEELCKPFDTFGQSCLEVMKAATKDMIWRLPAGGPYWLTFLGATGNGKTMLAKSIFNRAKKVTIPCSIVPGRTKYPWESLIPGMRVQWVDWRKLCDDLNNGQWHRIDEICDAWFVVLDDIGTEYDPKGMLKNKLDRILNSRIGMWTVITSNLFYDQIADKLDVRIASRMKRAGSIVVETNTTDYVLRT